MSETPDQDPTNGPFDELPQDDPEEATPIPDEELDDLDIPTSVDLVPDDALPADDDSDDGAGEEGGDDGSPVG